MFVGIEKYIFISGIKISNLGENVTNFVTDPSRPSNRLSLINNPRLVGTGPLLTLTLAPRGVLD